MSFVCWYACCYHKNNMIFYPRSSKKDKNKFHVLLTSFEVININNESLQAISWETMIVDEGHRLSNKDLKLFSALKQFDTRDRSLLIGTSFQLTRVREKSILILMTAISLIMVTNFLQS